MALYTGAHVGNSWCPLLHDAMVVGRLLRRFELCAVERIARDVDSRRFLSPSIMVQEGENPFVGQCSSIQLLFMDPDVCIATKVSMGVRLDLDPTDASGWILYWIYRQRTRWVTRRSIPFFGDRRLHPHPLLRLKKRSPRLSRANPSMW